MDTRLTRLEAIIPTLATREDLAHLEGRMNGAIQKVETTLHKELTNQTWLIVKWMSGLLVTLLPSLFAAVFMLHVIRIKASHPHGTSIRLLLGLAIASHRKSAKI